MSTESEPRTPDADVAADLDEAPPASRGTADGPAPHGGSRRFPVRSTAVVASLSVAATLLAAAVPAHAQAAPTPPSPWTIERVSTGFGGADSDGSSDSPVLSADGNHVVFESYATNLSEAPLPTTSGGSILAKDLTTGAVAQVSLDEAGSPLRYPYDPEVSGDGSVVVFTHDVAEANKVVRRDRSQAMSTTIAGVRPVRSPAIDDSGERVAYLEATSADASDRRQPIFVRDTGASAGSDPLTVEVSDLRSPEQRSSAPVISGDGTTVAYSVETPTGREVHVVDVSDLGAVPDAEVIAGGALPALDGAGRTVAYVARDGATRRDQVRVLDRLTGTDKGLLVVPQGAWITELDISADGTTVGFVIDGVADGPEVRVTTVASGRTEVAATGVRQGSDRVLDLGTDGRTIVFASERDDLVAGDGNGASDVFVARRSDASGPAWPAGASLTVGNVGSSFVEIGWPAADDDLGVTGYEVYLDGALVASLPAAARNHVISGLAPDTAYGVAVIAVDGEANPSTSLTASLTTAPRTTDPGTAPLLATPGPGGSVHLSWDPADGATAYRIMRAVPGSEELWSLADVDATSASFVDEGLMASSTYRYRVDAEQDGTFEPLTVETDATTSAMSIASTSWRGSGVVGDVIDLTIAGAPGWQGAFDLTHLTWTNTDGSLLDEPRAVTERLLAGEDGAHPGTYRATFTVAEGTASITAITGVLTDGVGEVVAAAPRVPIEVRAAAEVTVVASEGSLPGARVVIDGVAQSPIQGGAIWAVPSVPPGARTIRVLAANGRELASSTHTFVAGRTSELTITPAIPGTLGVRVLDTEGVAVQGAVVQFTSEGTSLGAILTDGIGLAVVPGAVDEGDVVDITVTPPRRLPHLETTSQATVVLGRSVHDVTLNPMPSGSVTGIVTLDGTTPAAGANVLAVQQVDGLNQSTTTRTGADGRYVLTGVAGPATIHVSHRQEPTVVAGTVELADPAAQLDVTLAQVGTVRVRLDLRTKDVLDTTWQDRALDLATAHLHHATLAVDGRAQPITGDDVVVKASPGDTVRFCAGGGETGRAPSCSEGIVGEGGTIDLALAVESRAAVRARLTGPNGAPLGRFHTTVTIARVVDGRRTFVRTVTPVDGVLDARLAEPGSYQLHIDDYSGPFMPATTRSVSFEVADGAVADLGSVVLSSSAWLERSSITAVRPLITPGAPAEIRAALKPSWSGTLSGLAARFSLPTGTDVVPGSATVDGEPTAFTMEGGDAVVALGDRSFGDRTADDPVVVRLRLATGEVGPGEAFDVPVGVTDAGQGDHVAAAGIATVRVAGVTMAAPSDSATHTIELSGEAPAGAEVSVHEGNQLVGMATASPGGRWFLTATLADLGAGHEHVLVATTEHADALLTSEPTSVVVDERLPVLERVAMVQIDNRYATVVEIDPMAGVARFPYVWEGPASGVIQVDSTFGGRGTVEDVEARVGSATAPANRVGAGRYVADVTVPSNALGGVGVAYDAIPDMATLDDIPILDQEQVRSSLPAQLADFGPSVVTESHDPVTNTSEAHFTTQLPSLGDGSQLEGTMSYTRGVTYTPTADDLTAASRAGVPIYGHTFTVTESGGRVEISGTAYISESDLGMGAELPAAGASLSSFYAPVRLGYRYAFTTGTSADSLISLFGWKEKYDRLNGLMDWANKNCSPEHAAWANSEIYLKNLEAVRVDLVKLVMVIGGGVLAPETLGIGTVALWASTFLIEKLVDWQQTRDVDRFKSLLELTCRWDDEAPYIPWDRDWLDVADPTWIHDPSGFVFEAVPSNRIEGVTATLLHSDTSDGTFVPWDAEWYGQSNPLTTDGLGSYGWDVPEGWWQVQYTKAGYEVARSDVLQVLPPHFDVNVGLVSLTAPSVASVDAVPGDDPTIEIRFDRYMELGVDEAVSVTTADGDDIAGTVEPVDAEEGPSGTFARTFRFVPDGDVPVGEELTVTVGAMASSYAGTPMESASTTTVTIAPAPAVRGTVTGPDGSPLAGVGVLAFTETDTALPTGYAVTAADGTYAIEGLADGSYRFFFYGGTVATSQWNGDAGSRSAAAPIAIVGGAAPGPVDAALVPVSSVSGTLTDASGAPLAGMSVQAYRPTDRWIATGTATTASDGTYRMVGLPAGSYQVRFSGPGVTTEWFDDVPSRSASTPVEVTAGATVEGVDASLATPSTVSGSVTGTDGAPLAGVTVMAFGERNTWVATATATTAADGSYRFIGGLPAGTYHVRFSGPGLATEWNLDARDRRRAAPVVVVTGASSTVDAVLASA